MPMNVSSVRGGTHAVAAAYGVGKGGAHRMQGALDAAAHLFGMTSQDLKDAIGSGRSMMSIAADKGVSSDDLVNALTQAMKAARPSGANGPGDSTFERIATRIANQSGPIEGIGQWGHHHDVTGAGSGGDSGSTGSSAGSSIGSSTGTSGTPTPSGTDATAPRTIDTYL